MRLLLDTHALLWWLDGDRRLSLNARRAITTGYLSQGQPLSSWYSWRLNRRCVTAIPDPKARVHVLFNKFPVQPYCVREPAEAGPRVFPGRT